MAGSEDAESDHSHEVSSSSQTTSQDAHSVGRARRLLEESLTSGKHFSTDYQRRMFLAWITGGRSKLLEAIIEIDDADPITADVKTPIEKAPSVLQGKVQLLAVLLTMSDKLIERLITGQVYRHYRTPGLRESGLGLPTLSRSTVRPKDTELKPVIYGNFLCDNNGQHLSYNQFSTVLDRLESYIEGLDGDDRPPVRQDQPRDIAKWAREIDERVRTGTPKGYEFHDTEKGQRRYVRTPAHRDQLKEWITTKRAHLAKWLAENTAEDGSLPDCDQALPWTVLDIGWTNYQPKRRNDHESHSGSIWLMNLVDSITRTHVSRHFQIRFLALYGVPFFALVPMAEHVLTRLASGYASSGGFNWTVAGKSTAGRETITERSWLQEQTRAEQKYIIRFEEILNAAQERRDFIAYSYSIRAKKDEAKRLNAQANQRKRDLRIRERELDSVYQELGDAVDEYLTLNKVERARELRRESEFWMEVQRDLDELERLTKNLNLA